MKPTGLSGISGGKSMADPERVLIAGLFEEADTNALNSEIAEVKSLVKTAGGVVAGQLIQKGRKPDRAFFLGRGKVEELSEYVRSSQIQTVVFVQQLSAVQQRNLEKELNLKIIDRTRLILDIFALRARTLQGKLQVELAQLLYLLPRLSGIGANLSRLGGGIGTRGPGEMKLETDRRVIRRKMTSLKKRLEKVKQNRGLQRRRRGQIPVPAVSIVGYTSAGKSTLFNRLADEGVFTTRELFATLDPLVRKVDLKEGGGGYYCLLSDTVGFIRDMPDELMTAFQATIEEVKESDILLLVTDFSDPQHEMQFREVRKILSGLGIGEEKIIRVYNKIDQMENREAWISRNREGEGAVYISARDGTGIRSLKREIFYHFFRFHQRYTITLQRNDPSVETLSYWAVIVKKRFFGDRVELEILCDRKKMIEFQKKKEESGNE